MLIFLIQNFKCKYSMSKSSLFIKETPCLKAVYTIYIAIYLLMYDILIYLNINYFFDSNTKQR